MKGSGPHPSQALHPATGDCCQTLPDPPCSGTVLQESGGIGGCFLAALRCSPLPTWLPGGVGHGIGCHPPATRRGGLSPRSWVFCGLTGVQTSGLDKTNSLRVLALRGVICYEHKPFLTPCSAASSDAYINRVPFTPILIFLLQISALTAGSCRCQLWF